MKLPIGLLALFLLPGFASAQGENFILFSATGDTLITRSSCYCKTPDALTSYFNVVHKFGNDLRLLTSFPVIEPGKRSIPCADFGLVPKDSIAKYGLYVPGQLGIMPRRFRMKSKILQVETALLREQVVYNRQVRHTFKIGRKSFYTATLWKYTTDKKSKIEKPRVRQVFGSKTLKRYFFIVILEDSKVDRWTSKESASYTHTRILN